jgi:polyisoprenoid-binding protein YceI
MKTKNILIAALGVVFAGVLISAKVVANKWNVATKEAKVSWNMPNGEHHGTFEGMVATFEFNPMDPTDAVLKASVDVNTVKSDAGAKLDGHLKTADFFDAANHPTMDFTAERIVKQDSGFIANGKLHIRDSIKMVDIPFKFIRDGKKATFKGHLEILAGDYGIMKKSEKRNDLVVIEIEVPVSEE